MRLARCVLRFALNPLSLALLLLIANLIAFAGERTLSVAIVTDGPGGPELLAPAALEREAGNVLAPGLRLAVRPAAFSGDWTGPGVDAALDAALADPHVDVVLAQGILAAHQAAHRSALPKPVIAPLVIDPQLQGFPRADAGSGRHNFAYIADPNTFEGSFRAFHQVVGFSHMVVLVDENILRELPQLAARAHEVAASLPARLTVLPCTADVPAMLAALPGDADAVFVAARLADAGMRELAAGLAARRLPSFAALGQRGLEAGLLMTSGAAPREPERLARRVVLMIQRLAQGEDAASFEVAFQSERHLALNMDTARAIGFSAPWRVLADAEQLQATAAVAAAPLTLSDALHEAVAANPALAASAARSDSRGDEVGIARSSLLPSLDASVTRTRIDADRASPLTQAENSSSAGYTLTQVLYSERGWANYTVAKLRYRAAVESHRQDVLDTLESAANAYLDLLRARSAEAVRRDNVALTRKNLEIARARESVGLGGHADSLRWVAQLARDKQELLSAESARRQAQTQLLRVLHRPADTDSIAAADLDQVLGAVATPRLAELIDSPARWQRFSDYTLRAAATNAPELAQADAQVAAGERSVSAARRAFFIPDLALVGSSADAFDRSGAGATMVPGAPDAHSWSVALQASLPLFDGLRRKSELAQARHDLRASERDRDAAADSIAARTRAALHRLGSSYPAIALSVEAASAADENLASVTDAYARGAVAITDLIDAQSTALSAGLAVTDAKYHFVADLVAVLRAVSEFDLLLDPQAAQRWLDHVYAGGAAATPPFTHEDSR